MIYLIYLLVFVIAIPYTSIFEWVLHRYPMHKPVWNFRYAFEAHAQVHHHQFKADHTYHLGNRDNSVAEKIRMAWWNIVVLLPIADSPFCLLAWLMNDPWIAIIPAIVILAYYGAYEYIHWCMHLPKERRLEALWIFYKLNGHHLLHHRYMTVNFNVVLPFADWIFRTLMTRAKTRFAQATGYMIPDVQPIQKDPN